MGSYNERDMRRAARVSQMQAVLQHRLQTDNQEALESEAITPNRPSVRSQVTQEPLDSSNEKRAKKGSLRNELRKTYSEDTRIRRAIVSMKSDFFAEDEDHREKKIMQVRQLLFALLTFTDFYVTCSSIDKNAAGEGDPIWFEIVSVACYVVYFADLCLSFYRERLAALKDAWIWLDIMIVTAGTADIIVKVGGFTTSGMVGILRCFRLLRVGRLIAMLRKLKFLKELWKLCKMLLSCLRTLFWSMVFCALFMTVWSMLAVELIHPLMHDLDGKGYWTECPLCESSFESVTRANLTLFKTIIAGDGWGLIAEPIILAHPETAFIFLGSLLTLVFGVLNLIVATVVDEFAETRQRDVQSMAEALEADQRTDLKKLDELFEQVDADGDGEISLEEIVEGAQRVPEFRSRLRVMDIDREDLKQLFFMMDENGSGSIYRHEFIGALNRWLHESKTASRFVKYKVQETDQKQDEILDLLRTRLDRLDEQMVYLVNKHYSDVYDDRRRESVQSVQSKHTESQTSEGHKKARKENQTSEGQSTETSVLQPGDAVSQILEGQCAPLNGISLAHKDAPRSKPLEGAFQRAQELLRELQEETERSVRTEQEEILQCRLEALQSRSRNAPVRDLLGHANTWEGSHERDLHPTVAESSSATGNDRKDSSSEESLPEFCV